MGELAHHFSTKNNVEVHLILYGIKRDIFYPLPNNVIVHKPVFIFNDQLRLISTLKTLLFLRKCVKHIKPASILSFGEYWNSFVLLATLGLKYPVFVSDRGQPDKQRGKFHDVLRNWLYPNAAGVIAQTQKAAEIYGALYVHDNIKVIGNPIRFIQCKDTPAKRENIVLMVGRLITSKHQDKLIEMFSKINVPNWKLVLVGYDHLKQKNMARLQDLVKQLGLEERVFLEGKQAEVESYYLRSKIFAFTSSSEGFPNVIGEAMAAGLPVIAFDCVAGPSDMIKDGENGFLIPLFDYESFTTNLEKLMIESPLRDRLGENARRSIAKFSSENIGEQFFQFIMPDK